jgi:hypothetical protein
VFNTGYEQADRARTIARTRQAVLLATICALIAIGLAVTLGPPIVASEPAETAQATTPGAAAGSPTELSSTRQPSAVHQTGADVSRHARPVFAESLLLLLLGAVLLALASAISLLVARFDRAKARLDVRGTR